jgi:ADP-ribose pyrophosphatase YjhB (NUDIX family)
VVLDAERRVACVEEDSGLFLPGGGIEAGEDAVGAAHREVAEECAHELEILASLPSAVQFHRATDTGRLYELRASFFLGRFGARLDREPQHRLHWIAAEPETPALFHACQRWAVEQAFAGAW